MSEDEYNRAVLAGAEKSPDMQESQFDGIDIRLTQTQLHIDDKFFNWINLDEIKRDFEQELEVARPKAYR